MKKIVLSIVSLALLSISVSVFTPGCTTTQIVQDGQTNTVTRLDPQKTADVIRAVVPVGVAIACQKDHNAAAYFHAASLMLTAAADSGNYDPAALRATLDTISIREVRDTPEVKAVIELAFGIYKAYFADAVTAKLDLTVWVRPVLSALGDGIEAGLPQ